jgi:cysteine desulfurase/selenocysteine lyase
MSITSAIHTPRSQAVGLHAFDVEKIRQDFPLLHRPIRGKPLVYLDNAATSQKPQVVLETLHHYYTAQNANIHRAGRCGLGAALGARHDV